MSNVYKCRSSGTSGNGSWVGKLMLLKKRRLEAERELDILSRFRHPNIVELVGHEVASGMILIVTMYEPLGDLGAFLKMISRSFIEQEAAPVFRQLLSATGFLHDQGVIHRDLKPENVFVASRTWEGNVWKLTIKLGDFGLSKIAGTCTSTSSVHGFVGTKSFAAPEMFQAQDGYHPASQNCYNSAALDLWSLGMMLHVLLTRSFPGNVYEQNTAENNHGEREGQKVACPCLSFQGQIDADIRRKVAMVQGQPSLQPLVLSLLRKDPTERMGLGQALAMLDEHYPDCSGAISRSSPETSAVSSHIASGAGPSAGTIHTLSTVTAQTLTSDVSTRILASEASGADVDEVVWLLQREEDWACAQALQLLYLQEASDAALAKDLQMDQRKQYKVRRREKQRQVDVDSACALEFCKQQLLEQQDEVRRRRKRRYEDQAAHQ